MFIHILYFTIMSILLSISAYAVNTPIHREEKEGCKKAGKQEGSEQRP